MSKPFKMKGHELPGPNQRSSAVKQSQEFNAEGFDASGNRTRRERQGQLFGTESSNALASGLADANEALQGYFATAQANTPPDGGPRANADTNAESLAEKSGERVKKGVDVEVTVNGKEV